MSEEPGPGRLLFTFVRHWSRRAASGDGSLADQGRLMLVTEAVAALVDRDRPATVNAIADEIGIDQSGASRLIRTAVEASLLDMTVSTADARGRHIDVTALGRAALDDAHAWQEEVFRGLTRLWPPARRTAFQEAMSDLIARSYELRDDPH
ncbi:MarR family winged helix-turn-helix transcriptional regulator [Microbacterium hydrocarbonoxydans]|uniref:MarR family winged helix-turn-helix transcriptional regulator n=1 Tax=Microbacterium hydrocarbonoxydans TaxID=273678 RepID=UPI003D98B587